jgi:hypothetical protein
MLLNPELQFAVLLLNGHPQPPISILSRIQGSCNFKRTSRIRSKPIFSLTNASINLNSPPIKSTQTYTGFFVYFKITKTYLPQETRRLSIPQSIWYVTKRNSPPLLVLSNHFGNCINHDYVTDDRRFSPGIKQ